jgi:hypothetical protein
VKVSLPRKFDNADASVQTLLDDAKLLGRRPAPPPLRTRQNRNRRHACPLTCQQRLLSPEQYEIVEARTSRGVSRVMLFSKAIIQAEWEANAPLREALAIKRERLRALRAKRAAKQCST